MAADDTFTQDFLTFLHINVFTQDLSREEIIARTDSMISAVADNLRAQFGTEPALAADPEFATEAPFAGPLPAGKIGGGVPHLAKPAPPRMDLLLEYAEYCH